MPLSKVKTRSEELNLTRQALEEKTRLHEDMSDTVRQLRYVHALLQRYTIVFTATFDKKSCGSDHVSKGSLAMFLVELVTSPPPVRAMFIYNPQESIIRRTGRTECGAIPGVSGHVRTRKRIDHCIESFGRDLGTTCDRRGDV